MGWGELKERNTNPLSMQITDTTFGSYETSVPDRIG